MGAQNKDVEEALRLREEYHDAYLNQAKDLLINALVFEGADLPKDAPSGYLVEKLFNNGKIAFDKDLKLWLPFTTSGYPNAYGKYDKIQLTGVNGLVLERKNGIDAFIVRFTPSGNSLAQWFDLMINDIIDLRLAIKGQAIAYQTPFVIEAGDKSNILTIKNAFERKKIGIPVIYANQDTKRLLDNALVPDAPFVIDKLMQAVTSFWNNILIRLGIIGGNQDKKERVESFELPIEYAIDSIYTLIDTFNHDCEKAGIDAHVRLNGAIEEMYNNENQSKKPESEAVNNE